MNGLGGTEFERILLIKPSSVGDIVHALPVLHGLRQRYPSAKISWLVNSAFADLLRDHPQLDEVIPFDRRRYGLLGRSGGATSEFISFIRRLRSRKFDLVIDLQGLFRSGFLSLACGAAVRVGFDDARELAWVFYSHCVPVGNVNTHAVDRYYRLSEVFGFDKVPPTFELAVTDQERDAVRRMLAEAGQADKAEFAAVLPGTRWETKVWPAERFSLVVDRLFQGRGIRSVLIGSEAEVAVCGRIADGCRSNPINLAGKTRLRDTVALIDLATVVLSHDSAPMHLASALGRPLVAVFGPTNPDRTGPYGRRDGVVQLSLPCQPCYYRKLSQCRYDHRCMKELSVDAVAGRLVDQLEKVLAAAPTATR